VNDSELRERLWAIAPPDASAAEQRAWESVRGGYRATTVRSRPARRSSAEGSAAPPWRGPRRGWRMTIPAVACLLALAVGTLAAASPPRQALVRWLRGAIGLSAPPRPRPLLAGLPGGGELLVNSAAGPWVVSPGGHRRRLGAYAGAAWSPHALYVIAWRDRRLAALDPTGRVQWALDGDQPVAVARWSPDGYRIAYLAGGRLWAVAGDGTGNHRLASGLAPVAPAWQPGSPGAGHRVAVVTRGGDVEVVGADSARRAWRATPSQPPAQLLWSPDGSGLLSIGRTAMTLYTPAGRVLGVDALPAGETIGEAAFAHAGDRLALTIRPAGQRADIVSVLDATPNGLARAPRVVFSAQERIDGIGWSPQDRWLLASSASADEWVFIGMAVPSRLLAVARVAAQFQLPGVPAGTFPALGGWQLSGR
jgi:hypothetical protein